MATLTQGRKVVQTWSFRGSKSRNKVSVGEPAEGSLLNGLLAFNLVNMWKQDVLRRFGVAFMLRSVSESESISKTKLSTKDLLALASMKNAAKREM